MIEIRTKVTGTEVFKLIGQKIENAVNPSAQQLAQEILNFAKQFVPKKTGNLLGAISIKKGSDMKGFGRYDVFVDMKSAPYASWIEYGRNAPVGLPYPEFANSKYKGANEGLGFLRPAVQLTMEPEVYGNIVAKEIIKSLKV